MPPAGTDFDGKNAANKDLFGGGSGAGVNIQPVAFLVVKDGCVRTIQLSDNADTINRALTMLPELVDKVSRPASRRTKRRKSLLLLLSSKLLQSSLRDASSSKREPLAKRKSFPVCQRRPSPRKGTASAVEGVNPSRNCELPTHSFDTGAPAPQSRGEVRVLSAGRRTRRFHYGRRTYSKDHG